MHTTTPVRCRERALLGYMFSCTRGKNGRRGKRFRSEFEFESQARSKSIEQKLDAEHERSDHRSYYSQGRRDLRAMLLSRHLVSSPKPHFIAPSSGGNSRQPPCDFPRTIQCSGDRPFRFWGTLTGICRSTMTEWLHTNGTVRVGAHDYFTGRICPTPGAEMDVLAVSNPVWGLNT
jgi:hypothetical protein